MYSCLFYYGDVWRISKEKVLSGYAVAVDVEGKSYQTWPLISGFAAMDKRGEDRQLYYRIDMSGLQYLFQLAYKEYEVEAGEITRF